MKYPYLKRVLCEQKEYDLEIRAWSDSDWAGCTSTRRSTTGSVVKLGNHTIQVKAATQKVVALSSAGSEYYGMCRTTTLAEFLNNVRKSWREVNKPVRLKVDSSAAKAMRERLGVGRAMCRPDSCGYSSW